MRRVCRTSGLWTTGCATLAVELGPQLLTRLDRAALLLASICGSRDLDALGTLWDAGLLPTLPTLGALVTFNAASCETRCGLTSRICPTSRTLRCSTSLNLTTTSR